MDLADELRGTATNFSYMTFPYIGTLLLDCEDAGLVDWRPQTAGAPLLRCPNASAVARFKAAAARGDVFWPAFPHNAMPGLYEPRCIIGEGNKRVARACARVMGRP